MLLQFFTSRKFIVSADSIIKIVRGAVENKAEKSVHISNKNVVDMEPKEAKKMLTRYPNEIEAWGIDAEKQAKPIKAKNSKQARGTPRDLA